MQPPDQNKTLRVASYNIRKAVGLDYRRDPARIARVIAGLHADVVAVQEADKRLGARPAAIESSRILQETDLMPIDLDPHSDSIGWHGNAVLVRKKVSVTGIKKIPLPGLEPRGAVKVSIENQGQAYTIVAAHLGLLRSYRRLQLETIRENLTPSEQGLSIILGDFNEWHSSRGLEALKDGFDVINPGKSFHSAWPVAGLDRIAIGKHLLPVNHGVVRTELTKVASDHLPIFADVFKTTETVSEPPSET